MLTWAIGSAALGAAACGDSLERACTDVGCRSQTTLDFAALGVTFEEGEVEACRNEQCWRATLRLNEDGETQFLRLDEADAYAAELRITPLADGLSVRASFPALNPSDIAVGDVLKVTFTDLSGTAQIAVSGKTRTVSDSYPNGPDCDPSPCRQATAEVTDS